MPMMAVDTPMVRMWLDIVLDGIMQVLVDLLELHEVHTTVQLLVFEVIDAFKRFHERIDFSIIGFVDIVRISPVHEVRVFLDFVDDVGLLLYQPVQRNFDT